MKILNNITVQQRKRLVRGIIGFVVLSILSIFILPTDLSSTLEQITLDYRYRTFNRDATPSQEIVYIDIDEVSLKKYEPDLGMWPWSRGVQAELINFLSAGEPKIILYDIIFSGENKNNEGDSQFAQTAESSGLVSTALQLNPEAMVDGAEKRPLPDFVKHKFALAWRDQPPAKALWNFPAMDFASSYTELMKKTPKLHVVNSEKDKDGILRRMPMLIHYDQTWLPSLSLGALLGTLKNPLVDFDKSNLKIFDGKELKWHVPLDKEGKLQLHFYPEAKRPTTLPIGTLLDNAHKVLKGEIDDPEKLDPPLSFFKDKIVIFGASATGLEDLKATPVSPNYPGVLLHTTAISNILKQDFLQQPPLWFTGLGTFVLIFIAYFCVFFFENIIFKSILPLLALILHFASALFLFKHYSFQVALAIPVAFGFLALIDAFIYMSFVEGKERKKITGTLSKYLSPEVTKHLIESGIDPSAEVGHKQELSILFSDIRGFTTLSEKLSAEQVVSLLNRYLERMTHLVFEHKGTLDKFIGDAVMAFWGAPLENKKHAEHAVDTAMAMIVELKELNKQFVQEGHLPLQIGIGINTGIVVVGNIGSDKRLDYTVIGDNVNLTSRIEGLTKQYAVQILIGESTYEQIKHKYYCRAIDLVKVKGKAEPKAIYEPLCLLADQKMMDQLKPKIEAYNKARALYLTADFASAKELFVKIEKDGPSAVMIERCEHLIQQPPPQWDGVYEHKTK